MQRKHCNLGEISLMGMTKTSISVREPRKKRVREEARSSRLGGKNTKQKVQVKIVFKNENQVFLKSQTIEVQKHQQKKGNEEAKK